MNRIQQRPTEDMGYNTGPNPTAMLWLTIAILALISTIAS